MTTRRRLSLAWMAASTICFALPTYAGAPIKRDADAPAPAKDKATANTPNTADTAADPDAAKFDLQYKFHIGETIRSQVVHLATVETTISGTSQHTETTSRSIKAWKVTGVDKDGQMTFEHMVESIDMRTAMSGKSEIRYNSETDAKPPAGYEDAAKSVGRTLATVTIGMHGNVVKRSDPPNATTAAGAATQIVIPLPDQPVAIGHVWTVPRDLDVQVDRTMSKKIKTRERYELEGVKNGVATIGVETQILTPIDDPKIKVQLIQKTSRGKIRFDMDAGRVIGQQLDLDERVLAFSGADSSMHYLTRYTEELLGPDAPPAKTARKIDPVKSDAAKSDSSPAKPTAKTDPAVKSDAAPTKPTAKTEANDGTPKSVMVKPSPSGSTPSKAETPPNKLPPLVDLKAAIKRANEPSPADSRTANRPKTDANK